MKKIFAFLMVVLCCTGTVFAGGKKAEDSSKQKDKYVFGISQFYGTVAFTQTIVQGARDAAADWSKQLGVEIEFYVTDAGLTDPSNQIGDMEDLAAQGVDALLLFPGDSSVVVEPLKNLYNKNNIPVVITDIGVAGGDYLSFIITDNKLGGTMGAETMAELVPGRGKVIIFQNSPGMFNAQQRARGFTEKATELGFNVLGEKTLTLTVEAGKSLMEDVLASDPDIAGVFTISLETAIGAASALADAKNTTCKVVAFDINKTAYEMIKNGQLGAAIIQDPYFMGHEGLNQLMYHFTGQTNKIQKEIGVKTSVLKRSNAEEFKNNPQIQ